MPFIFQLIQKIVDWLTISTTRFEEQDVTAETDQPDEQDLSAEAEIKENEESQKYSAVKIQTLALLTDGKTEEALTVLRQFKNSSAILVLARLTAAEKAFKNKLISFRELDMELNRIHCAVLEILNGIKTNHRHPDFTVAGFASTEFQPVDNNLIFEMIDNGQTESAIASCQYISNEYFILLNARYYFQRKAFDFGDITQSDWDNLLIHIHEAIKEIVTNSSYRK